MVDIFYPSMRKTKLDLSMSMSSSYYRSLKIFQKKPNVGSAKIRDVAYQTEDIIDLFTCKRKNPSHVKLEDLLKDVKQKIGTIAGAMMEDRPAAISSSALAPAATSSSSRVAHACSDTVIGLDDDLMAMKDRLCGLLSKLQVIPIMGVGGIGKTTLARTVYNDSLIMRHFDIRAWLTISKDYSPQNLKKILLGLADSMKLLKVQMFLDKIDDSEISLKLYKNLNGRRYLVVMDDVWGTEVWDNVRNIFPDDCNGNRIVLTSRVLDVAAYPDSNSRLHQMQFMTASQSWDLLKHKVFGNNYCPWSLQKVGKQIAQKCLGLPLVVVLVAGFLSSVDQSVDSWEEISKTANTSIGQESDKILSLSYSHLPHH